MACKFLVLLSNKFALIGYFLGVGPPWEQQPWFTHLHCQSVLAEKEYYTNV
jgi:hypothetical protein